MTKNLVIWGTLVAFACALAVGAWGHHSSTEYASCRDEILAQGNRAFPLDRNSVMRLDAAVNEYATKRPLGNFLAVLMRNECRLAPPSYRDSAIHRLLWSTFLKAEDTQTVARLVLALSPATKHQLLTQHEEASGGPLTLTDSQLKCLVEHALHLRRMKNCELVTRY